MNRTGKLWRGWAIGVALVWLVAFILPPGSDTSPPLARPVERWNLSELPEKPDLKNAAAVVANSLLWGVRPKPDAPVEDTRWSITAIFLHGSSAKAMIRFAVNKPPLTLMVGDKLPDGAEIKKIEAGQVCATLDKKDVCLPVPPLSLPGF